MKRNLILFLVLVLSGNCFGSAIAQWKMNDNADDTVVLDSIGSYNGVFHSDQGGGDEYTSAHQVGDANSQLNGALEYALHNYITIADQDVFTPDGTPMSITAWVQLSAHEGAADFYIANKMDAAGLALEWTFEIGGDALRFILYDQSASQACIGRYDSTTNYALYEGSDFFIFVVGTYDGGSSSEGIKLYLDGQQVDDTRFDQKIFVNVDNGDEDVRSGIFDVGRSEGVIDNLVIYDTELSEAQIISLYNNGVGTEDVGLTSVAENSMRSRTMYGYRKYYRNRY